jgi:hypothetical protein
VPRDKLSGVVQAALEESRRRTKLYIALPDSEGVTLEFVTNQHWGGYNRYQGQSRSLIQINTDLPVFIGRVLDLAAHEGYPGHQLSHPLSAAVTATRGKAPSEHRRDTQLHHQLQHRARSGPRLRHPQRNQSRPGHSLGAFRGAIVLPTLGQRS